MVTSFMRYENDLHVVLQEIVARWGIPGLAVGAVAGGEIAAYARYDQLKAEEAEAYDFDAYDLETLVIQLVSAKKIDLAIDVLGLNIHVHPEHVESYLARARLYLRTGEAAQAEESLRLARSIRQHR